MFTVSSTLKSVGRLRWLRVCIQIKDSPGKRWAWPLGGSTWKDMELESLTDRWLEKAAKIARSARPRILTEHCCLVISCLSPPCTEGSPIGIGTHPSFSLSGQIPMHPLGLSSNRSLVKLPLANPLPYLSDKVHSCRLCLPTTLNPHLDHDTYCPPDSDHSSVCLHYWIITSLREETRFSLPLFPQCPTWNWYNDSWCIFILQMN